MKEILSFIVVAIVCQRSNGAVWTRATQDPDQIVSDNPSNILTEQAKAGDVLLANTDPEPLTGGILTNSQEQLNDDTNGINANISSEENLQIQPNLTANAAGNLKAEIETPSIDVPPLVDTVEDTIANEGISLPNMGIYSNPLNNQNPFLLINSILNEFAQRQQAFQQFMFANNPFPGMQIPSMRRPSFNIPSPPSVGNYFNPTKAYFNSLPPTPQQPMELVNHDIINDQDGKLQGEIKEWQSPPDPNKRANMKVANVSYNDDNVKGAAHSYSSSSAYSSTGLKPESTNNPIFPPIPRFNFYPLNPARFEFTLPRFQ